MASCLLLLPSLHCYQNTVKNKDKWNYKSNSKFHRMEEPDECRHINSCFLLRCSFTSLKSFSQGRFLRLMPAGMLSSSMESLSDCDQTNTYERPIVPEACSYDMEFNRVNRLVWVLHQSASGFSSGIQELEMAQTGPELAMAWVGVDVHAWHKSIAYQVAVYSLLKAAMEVELFLSHKRCSIPSVNVILSEKANLLGERIESQLHARNPKLVQWFKTFQVPHIAGQFIPLFKNWSIDYAGSGVAGIILAISCCSAIRKLCAARVSCPLFPVCFEDGLAELMNLSNTLVSVDKLHQLSCEAGFEEEFLSHFGRKIFPCHDMDDIEFWIGLVQKKLSAAFHREGVILGDLTFCDKVQEMSLVTMALFAYLGRETRLFLAGMKLNDLEEHTVHFLNYLECGYATIYPEFSVLSKYQLLMEVVIDEIGWLSFYPPVFSEPNQDKRRSKQHTIQAEQEIILYHVFTVCYDIISGFAHFSNSTQQSIDSNLLKFLLNSQSLLSTCMEDYWAAYDKTSGEQHKKMDRSIPEPMPSLLAHKMPTKFTKEGKKLYPSTQSQVATSGWEEDVMEGNVGGAFKDPLYAKLLKKSMNKLLSVTANAWMGTQLLFIDICDVGRILKKRFRRCRFTKREVKKIKRTMTDFFTLIPVIVLMLIPVSAVGHAAILGAINKYMPYLIPSTYTTERLGLVRRLNRIKSKELQPRSSNETASSKAA